MNERFFKRIFRTRHYPTDDNGDEKCNRNTSASALSSEHVQSVAETILRTAKDGERDPAVLQRMALLELALGVPWRN
jgi:hypothetical protein